MKKIIAITNQKGGVGKTTSTINLAAALGMKMLKVLVIDFDPQGNMTLGFGKKEETSRKDIYKVLNKEMPIQEAIIKNVARHVDLIPASPNLAAFDIEQAQLNRIGENPLKDAIESLKDNYDYILIDCPPSLGLLNRNALAVSDSVIIPIQAEFFALEGLTQLFGTIRLVQHEMGNRNLFIHGVLITMYDSRLNISKEVLSNVKSYFGEKLFKTIIPRNVSLSEAPSYGINVIDYKKNSSGARAYMKLADEILNPENNLV